MRRRAQKLRLKFRVFCRKTPAQRKALVEKADLIRKHKLFLLAKAMEAQKYLKERNKEIRALLKELNEELEDNEEKSASQEASILDLEAKTWTAAEQVDVMESVSKDEESFMFAYMPLSDIRRILGLYTELDVKAYNFQHAFDLIVALKAFGLDMNAEHDADLEFTADKNDKMKEELHQEIIKHLKIGDQLRQEAQDIMGLDETVPDSEESSPKRKKQKLMK